MARLVGMPCGVATQLVLDGVINKPGILAPMSTDLVYPLIKAIEAEGVSSTPMATLKSGSSSRLVVRLKAGYTKPLKIYHATGRGI
ncbi:hypothetical protein BGX21_002591 [Mortierella sp. AD011]|nr:hypothetical protein BGX21_002591 [Mortierella sp. AD011]